MTDREDKEKECQFAEITIKVAVPLKKDGEDDWRERFISESVETAVERADGTDFHHVIDVALGKTETMEERAMALQAIAESEREKELADRRERYFDNNGHF